MMFMSVLQGKLFSCHKNTSITNNIMLDVEELSIPVPWGVIAAKAWGSPDNTKVLAIHGFHDNAGSFDQLIPELNGLFYVVCVDLPGHGLSSHFPPGLCFSLIDIVCALKRIVDHLHWSQFSLLAHSFGGHVAIYFTALFGDSIHRLILIDVFFAVLIPEGDFVLERCLIVIDKILNIESKTKQTFTYEQCLKKLCDERVFKLDMKSAKALQKRAFTETPNGYIHNNDQRLKLLSYPLITANFHHQLIKNSRCNLLVISTSAFEPFFSVPMTQTSLDELKSNSSCRMKFVKIQGSHDVHMDNPLAVAPIIKEFILHQKSHL